MSIKKITTTGSGTSTATTATTNNNNNNIDGGLDQYQAIPTSPRRGTNQLHALFEDDGDATLDVVEKTLGNLDEVDITIAVSRVDPSLSTIPLNPKELEASVSGRLSHQDHNSTPPEFLNYIVLETSKKNGTKQDVIKISNQDFFEKSEKLWDQSERQALMRTGIKEFIVMKHIVVYPVYNRTTHFINFWASPDAFSAYSDADEEYSPLVYTDMDNTISSSSTNASGAPFKNTGGYNPFADIPDNKTIHIVNKLQLISFSNPYKKDLEFNITGFKRTLQGKSCVCSFKIPQRMNRALFIPTTRIRESASPELMAVDPLSASVLLSPSSTTSAAIAKNKHQEKSERPQLLRKESKLTLNTPIRIAVTKHQLDEKNTPETPNAMSSWYETLNDLSISTPTNFISDIHSLDSIISREIIFLLMGLDYKTNIADHRMFFGNSIEVLDCKGVVYIFLKYIFKRHVSVPFTVEDSRQPGVLREMVCVTKSLADSIHHIIVIFMNYLQEQSCSKTRLIYKSDGTFERPLQEEVKLGAYKFIDTINTDDDDELSLNSQENTKREIIQEISKEERKDQEQLRTQKAIHYLASPENVVTICLAVSLFMCPNPNNTLKTHIDTLVRDAEKEHNIGGDKAPKNSLPSVNEKEESEDDDLYL
jgi:hypothetical protein